MSLTSNYRHVHSQCDPEANESTFLEKRSQQHNYMYSCKVCKGQAQRAATMAPTGANGSSTPSITSPRDQSDDSMTPDAMTGRLAPWSGM